MERDIKTHFLEELKRSYQTRIASAARAEAEANQEADPLRSDARRREDVKEAIAQGRLAKGHRRRREVAVAEMQTLLDFTTGGLRHFGRSDRIGIGALVDVRVEDDQGEDERTLFFLPVGAGTELRGPGGDGFVVVVTPKSPVGKALYRARAGDCFEIVIDGRDREWTVLDLA